MAAVKALLVCVGVEKYRKKKMGVAFCWGAELSCSG